jgi:hypothetical protein
MNNETEMIKTIAGREVGPNGTTIEAETRVKRCSALAQRAREIGERCPCGKLAAHMITTTDPDDVSFACETCFASRSHRSVARPQTADPEKLEKYLAAKGIAI